MYKYRSKKTITNRELMCLSKRRSKTLSLLLGCGSISIADLFLTKVTGIVFFYLWSPVTGHVTLHWQQHNPSIGLSSGLAESTTVQSPNCICMYICLSHIFFVSFNSHTQYCDLNVVEILSINHWFLSWLLYYVVGGGRMRIEGWYACHIQCIHLLALLLHRVVRLQQTRGGNPNRNLRKENSNLKFQEILN